MRTPGWKCVCAALMLIGASPGLAAPPGVHEFAGGLYMDHAYLLSSEEKSALDRINRRLREVDQAVRDAKDDAARRDAQAKLDTAADRLIRFLDGLEAVRKVSIESGRLLPSLDDVMKMPASHGAVLLRIDAGGEGARFVTQSLDQARREHSGTITIECSSSGVVYALIGLFNLPVGPTIFPFEIKRDGSEPVRALLKVAAPGTGRVAVRILSDDTGKPTPAMVRMIHKDTGREITPANAVDFSNQFDGNGHNSGHRRANLADRLGGWWWCVPEPFEMALPPGTYEIAIRHGTEHLPVFDSFKVQTGELTRKTFRPKRWVDMRHLGWYSGDDHVHCQILSDDDAQRLMAWIRAEDVHVANIVKMGDILRTYFEQRGFGPVYRVIADDYVASPGQECPRTHGEIGHTLAMNTTSMVRDTDQYYLYDRVADTVHAQGGLWGYAHVNSGMFHVHRDMSINIPKGKCDFVEILQFSHLGTDLYYEFLNAGFKVTASAGSDVPWGGTIGEVRVYAYIGDQPFTADAWFAAVGAGRTFVTNGPMLQFTVDDALPGDEVLVKPDRMLRVQARAWGHSSLPMPHTLQIIRHGDVIQQTEELNPETGELILNVEVDPGDGFWLAAKVIGHGNTWAHTTPVYVVREGLRFWKHGAIDDLLDKRVESLRQIEEIVSNARARHDAGELDGDQTLQQLAIQGPELLKRVDAARAIYADLRKTAADERSARIGG